MRGAACIDCEYAETVEAPGEMLRCRRYAPRPQPVDGKDAAGISWPLVQAHDWCGEYLERESSGDEGS